MSTNTTRLLSGLAVTGAAVLNFSPAMAQNGFSFTPPNLGAVKECVLEADNDVAAGAQCYNAYETICFDNWFKQYSACIPHETAFWSETLNRELQGSAGADGAAEMRAAINENMSEACPAPEPRYRQICEAHFLRDNAVLLHMRRLWAGGDLSN
ncbi:hypothetical protein [Hyphococcus sp.]|uniref:hypothetical protein n=1 Tax=Hyphococcus sp. TaxID=2038636 RepID=UPI003CCBD706